MVSNEMDHLSIAIGGLLFVASRLMEHAEAIPSVMNIREALEEVVGGLLGLIEFAGVDEIDGGVGGDGESSEFDHGNVTSELVAKTRVESEGTLRAFGRCATALCCFVFR